MCGFVGVVRSAGRGPVTRQDLEPLGPWLAHRGPDGEGLVAGGTLGLLATRLAIQGDRSARQPLVSGSGRVALAFNGEILGAGLRRLRAAIARAGGRAPPATAGDSAALLAAFTHAVEHGAGLSDALAQEALEILAESMGALAVLDLAAGRALLARDRLGIKPLHLLEVGPHELWFASEIEPLLRVRGAAPPDLAGLAALVRQQRPGERLPWAGLRALPARSALEVDPDLTRRARRIGPDPLSLPRRAPAEAEAARRELAAALAATAREAAQVDGPVTLFLSGGLDSAAIAAAAGRPDLLALTGRFAPHGGALDESAGARAVAQALGLAHEVLDLSDADLLADLPEVVRALELPLAGPGSLSLWRLFAHAREQGRVVLTGTGGDELLGGYARTALALGRAGPWTQGYEDLERRLAPLPDAGARARAAHDRSGDLLPLLAPDFAAALRAAAPSPAEAGSAAQMDALAAALEPELTGTLPTLLHVEDRLAAAHGLEGRPVFCLGRLPRAALALPPDEVVGPDGEGKRALRALLAGRIPEEVRASRLKRGFPTPFARAARGAGRARAQALLEDRRFRERGWWNVAASRALLDEERPVHDRALFALLAFETWARLYLDGDVHALPPRGARPVTHPR